MNNDSQPCLPSLKAAMIVTEQRLQYFPDSPFFLYAKRDLNRIAERFASAKPVDKDFYKNLKIGIMCARELETADMPYCELIYKVLDDIRPSA